METFKLPNAVYLNNPHLSETWQLFQQLINNYFLVTEKTSKPNDVKIAVVLSALGPKGLHVFNIHLNCQKIYTI